MMKTIVILGTAFPFRGGLAAFNERLAEEFIKMGHTVHIVTFSVQYPTLLFPGKSQMSDDPAPDLDIKRWVHSFNPFNWIIASRKIKSLKPDLIVCKYWLPVMGPCLGTVIRWSRLPNTSTVCILDNVIPHEKRPGDQLFTRYFLGSIDRFIFMSHQVGADLLHFETHKRAVFIPHPIYDNYGDAVPKSTAIQYLKLDPTYRYILFFGFIRDYKGLDLFFAAISLLKDQKDVKFIVAGEYYVDSAPYDKLRENLGINDQLILHTHFIKNEDVKYYFSASDLIVQPYKSATQSGIAQIAIHFLKPAVVTKVGGLHEIISDGHTGYVAEPNSVAIASAITTFLAHPEPESFEHNLEVVRKQYAWSLMANAALGAGQKDE
jgi:glycosyltransferase involved in cell wall biosynthesis